MVQVKECKTTLLRLTLLIIYTDILKLKRRFVLWFMRNTQQIWKKKNILYEYTYTTRAELPSKMIPHTFKSIFLLTHSKRVSWAQVTASMSRRYYINNITNLLIWVLLLLTSNFIVNNVAAIRKTFEFITHILYLLRSLFIYIYIRTVII